jgi:hypothetical protein
MISLLLLCGLFHDAVSSSGNSVDILCPPPPLPTVNKEALPLSSLAKLLTEVIERIKDPFFCQKTVVQSCGTHNNF